MVILLGEAERFLDPPDGFRALLEPFCADVGQADGDAASSSGSGVAFDEAQRLEGVKEFAHRLRSDEHRPGDVVVGHIRVQM